MFSYNSDRGLQSGCLSGGIANVAGENQNVLLTSKDCTDAVKACCLNIHLFFDFYILIFMFVKQFQLYVQNSSLQDFILMDMTTVNETFTCLLYPTNLLNCSWSFDTLQKDTQLSVHIRYSYCFKLYINI